MPETKNNRRVRFTRSALREALIDLILEKPLVSITVKDICARSHTLGISVDLPTALLLCLVSTVGACGASGVAGGSLLLIPVACASFGIGNDIAMQVVGVGFIIGVIQDACETALNSSTDVLFTATAEFAQRAKEGKLRDEDMVPHSN